MISSLRTNGAILVALFTILFLGISCEQYEYFSPSPGILEVRFRTQNSRAGSFLPYGVTSNLTLNLQSLQVRQPGNIKLPIYVDLNAVQRNDFGDFYNCLSDQARDSSLVWGRVYAPPGTYTGLDFSARLTPNQLGFGGGVGVTVVRDGIPGFFSVFVPFETEASQLLPKSNQPPFSIPVETDRRTIVTVTLDLDSSLVRRTEDFRYRPYFYVSSIRTF